MQILLIFT